MTHYIYSWSYRLKDGKRLVVTSLWKCQTIKLWCDVIHIIPLWWDSECQSLFGIFVSYGWWKFVTFVSSLDVRKMMGKKFWWLWLLCYFCICLGWISHMRWSEEYSTSLWDYHWYFSLNVFGVQRKLFVLPNARLKFP